MVVAGFPSKDKPYQAIFNLRAAKLLKDFVDIKVIHLRTWLPGRPLVEHSEIDGIPSLIVPVLQLPGIGALNMALGSHLSWRRVRPLLTDCDLVHSVGCFAGVLAAAWTRRTGACHVFQAIGSDVNAFLPRLKHKYPIAGWESHLQAVACNSRALAEAFGELYPTVKNVRTVRRGVDLHGFNPTGRTAGPLVDKPPVRYLFLGGFPHSPDLPFGTNTKGGDTLMAAWAAAEEALIASGASLLITGHDALHPRVQKWRTALKSPENVHLRAPIAGNEVPAYIRAADAVLIPSMQEGLPNVAVEAAACGRAVLASRVGGIPEAVLDGQTGILLPAGDLGAWTQALSENARQYSRLQTMGHCAREYMESHFNCREYPRRMMEVYEAALGKSLDGEAKRVPVEAEMASEPMDGRSAA